ncbi:MAG: nucleotidyl transferase AbiEii/AbiGii toxin family protein [Myxococcaceae bacterium]
MNNVLEEMLKPYHCQTAEDYKNALKEVIQELALLGLWRAKFFEHAAFYGGTALRILFGLNRFSEDMDFSLLEPNPNFSLKTYENKLMAELKSFGLVTHIETKIKTHESAILSAFLKSNTVTHFLEIGVPNAEQKKLHHQDSIRIKIEVDTNPPPLFSTTVQYLLQPVPFFVKTYSEPDLFAGKMHAVLCRSWKTRVKGRDWYDLVWFVSRKTPLHLAHLEARMRQSGHYLDTIALSKPVLHERLQEKIESLDIAQAKADIEPFLKDKRSLEIWSTDFFHHIARGMEINA